MKRYYKPNCGHGEATDETMTVRDLGIFLATFKDQDMPVVVTFDGMYGGITEKDFSIVLKSKEPNTNFTAPATLVIFD